MRTRTHQQFIRVHSCLLLPLAFWSGVLEDSSSEDEKPSIYTGLQLPPITISILASYPVNQPLPGLLALVPTVYMKGSRLVR